MLGRLAIGVLVGCDRGYYGRDDPLCQFDGDGLTNFLAMSSDRNIRMWENMGIVGGKGSSLRFADLNGGGKDNIVSVVKKGRPAHG